MTDCMNQSVFVPGQWALSNRSDIYGIIKGLANVKSASVSISGLDRPDFDSLQLTGLTLDAAAHIQSPQGSAPAAPQGNFDLPSLSGVTYNAVNSLIHLKHTSPLLNSIGYATGLDAIQLPQGQPSAPPLNYPTEGLQDLPPGPGDQTIEAPRFVLGDKPDMVPIRAIDYQPSGLQPVDLSGYMPEYEPPDVSELEWQAELRYEDDADLRAKLQQLMLGGDEVGDWIGSVVQAKLYDADIRELERKTKTQIDQIMERSASRNFSLPNGAAQAEVMREAYTELDDSYTTAQRVKDEVYEAAINTLAEAIGRSIAIEQYHFKLYLRYVRQNLRVYQLNLELATRAYNALVDVFTRVESAVRVRIDAYSQYIRAVSDENQSIAAQAQFTEAQVATYRARVEMFSADVGLRQKSAQVIGADVRQQTFVLSEYQSELRGVMGNLRIVEQNVESLREAVRAYSNHMQWYDDAIGAYEASIEASSSKVAVNAAKFDAYRQLWSAEGDRLSSFNQYLSASTSAFDAALGEYREASGAQREYLGAVVQSLGASTQLASSYAQAAQTMAGWQRSWNTAKISEVAATNDTSVAKGVVGMTQDALVAEAEAHTAKLDAARNAAKATAGGALAQAGATIFQVSASATAGASHRVSGRDTGSNRYSASDRKSFSKVCTYVERPMTI